MKKVFYNKKNGYEYEVSIKEIRIAVGEAKKIRLNSFGVRLSQSGAITGNRVPYSYDRNEYPDKPEGLMLDGVSCVGYSPEYHTIDNKEKIISSLSVLQSYYCDERCDIVLIAGTSSTYGDDDGEHIIKEAYIIHVFPLKRITSLTDLGIHREWNLSDGFTYSRKK